MPTGFITAQSGIDKGIREHLVQNKMLAGVVSMPSNIFATTGTNVSILFIDASNKEKVVLIDASNLGEKVKDGKNQKTVLTECEEKRICEAFNNKWAKRISRWWSAMTTSPRKITRSAPDSILM